MPPRHHLYLASNFWDGLWIIQQPITHEIQRDEQVLFVERWVSLATVVRYPRLWRRLFAWMRGARRETPNLRLLAPLPLIHLGHRFPRLFRLEFALQRWWILFWARGLRGGSRILWMDNPLYEAAVGRMGEDLAVYHVGDEVSAFPTSDAAVMQMLEGEMLRKADVAFVAADGLAATKATARHPAYAIWNGISTEAFDATPPAAFADRLAGIVPPRVAFVGVIDRWVDVQLLERLAHECPEIQLVIAGVSRVDVRSLRAMPNVHWLGRQPRTNVPAVLRACAASVVPFERSELTARIMPVKILESLAAGTLPVCTDFSMSLGRLVDGGYIRVAASADAFIEEVCRAVATESPARRAALEAFGRQQTWNARWNEMRSILDDVQVAAPGNR